VGAAGVEKRAARRNPKVSRSGHVQDVSCGQQRAQVQLLLAFQILCDIVRTRFGHRTGAAASGGK
jgi:hypothetical protein